MIILGDVFRVCVCGSAGIRRRKLLFLGSSS